MSDDPKKVCRDLNELRPDFRFVLLCALQDANDWGLDCGVEFRVIETYRPQARQNYLYSLGRSRPGGKVTWTRRSRHTDRLAADVVPMMNRRIMWKRKDLFDKWGEFAEKQGLRWGGRFGTYDGAHVEWKEG